MDNLSPCITGMDRPAVCYENHRREPIVMVPKKPEVLGIIDMQGGKGSCRTTDGKLCPTILAAHGDIHAVFVAECLTAKGADDRMPDKGRLPCVIEPIVMATGQANAEITYDVSPTLTRLCEQTIVLRYSQLRRFTPRECERLQGFPDDWTKIPWRNKPAEQCPDGLRYKACGNSMAVPVMRWIGERIEKVKRERK